MAPLSSPTRDEIILNVEHGERRGAARSLSSPRTETEPVALNDMQTQTQTDAPNETEAPADSEEKDALSAGAVPEAAKEPADVPPATTLRPDWSSYFGDLNGAAVIFDPDGFIRAALIKGVCSLRSGVLYTKR